MQQCCRLPRVVMPYLNSTRDQEDFQRAEELAFKFIRNHLTHLVIPKR
jgi:hypothetical protein